MCKVVSWKMCISPCVRPLHCLGSEVTVLECECVAGCATLKMYSKREAVLCGFSSGTTFEYIIQILTKTNHLPPHSAAFAEMTISCPTGSPPAYREDNCALPELLGITVYCTPFCVAAVPAALPAVKLIEGRISVYSGMDSRGCTRCRHI